MTIIDRRYSVAEGQAVKSPCRAATTANITLSGEQTIDGVAVVDGDRVLVKNQSTASQNGIYSCSTGNWTRTRDFDGAYDVVTGTRVFVTSGTANGGAEFVVSTTGTITIDSTAITFTSIIATATADAAAAAASAAAASASQTAAASSASAASSSASSASTSATSAAASAVSAAASRPVVGAFKNLSIKVATNTTVTVAADLVAVTDGTNFQTIAISGTCDLGANGAVNRLDTGTIATSTWYAIWAIAKADGTQGTLASTSASAPTMPTGYTFKARIGWVRTASGSAQLLGTWQFGRRTQYKVGLAQTSFLPIVASGVNGTYSASAPTWTTPSVTSVVPTTASEIYLVVANTFKSGTNAGISVAPSSAYSGYTSASGNAPWFDTNSTPQIVGVVPLPAMLLEGTTVGFVSSQTGGALLCSGWIDNL